MRQHRWNLNNECNKLRETVSLWNKPIHADFVNNLIIYAVDNLVR